MYGWVLTQNLKEIRGAEKRADYCLFKQLLNKFPKDAVDWQNASVDGLFDGYVLNKKELCKQYSAETWQDVFGSYCLDENIGKEFRGGFCGYVINREKKEIMCYTDHMGNRPVYYFCQDDKVAIASNLNLLVQVLRENRISLDVNEDAVRYMLTFGAMIDDSTFVKGVRRVLPGHRVVIRDGESRAIRYYQMDNQRRQESLSEEEAIERIDSAFRLAVKQEFEKDKEYGYRHLVDLSGGLDSRMVCWVAHELGYTDQLNFTYCRRGYLDHKISEKIAMDLKHEYLFKPLDDINWMYDVDEIVEKNNGAAMFDGITGGNRLLCALNTEHFGLEHTGMVGDVIPSSFYKSEEIAFASPQFGRHLYSNKLHYEYDENILAEYPNQEIFALVTRGLLCAASSFIIRQNYLEVCSPFLHVDFLDACLSLPFSYRAGHYIYLRWINERYPAAANYGWEKWGGVRPKKSHIPIRRFVTLKRLSKIYINRVIKKPDIDNMNPVDYWFLHDAGVQKHYREYYVSHFPPKGVNEALLRDLEELFENGNVTEKGMVLTVLAAIERYCA